MSQMEPLLELRQLIARYAPLDRGGRWKSEPLGFKFSTASNISEPTPRVYQPVFALVVQGEKQLVLADKVFTCGKGTFIVVTVDLPLTFQISRATRQEPYMALVMTLKPAAVATLLLEAASAEHPLVETEPAGMGVSDAPSELLEAVVRLARLLDHPRDLPVLGPIAEKEILWRLLCSEQGYRLRQVGLADSRLSQIGRAMRWMREHYREALPIEELARLSAMSVTSFHRHFRAVAMMSPLQYLKQIRLQEARARLLANAEDIATVGRAVGYDSPSQFSREYKRAYGSPPGQDARLLRASNGNAPAVAQAAGASK
jgi:AraC-like DNA-binding protein